MYNVYDRVTMTEDALDNYGEEYRDVVFKVTQVARNENDHPGYDMGVYPQRLYDLSIDGNDFACSLYDYELKRA